MELSTKFTDKIKEKYLSLSDERKNELLKEDEYLEDIDDFLVQDYVFVNWLANEIGIHIGEAYLWCGSCETESKTNFNTDTFEWLCPACGKEHNKRQKATVKESFRKYDEGELKIISPNDNKICLFVFDTEITNFIISEMHKNGVIKVYLFETNEKTNFKELLKTLMPLRPHDFSEESNHHFRIDFRK